MGERKLFCLDQLGDKGKREERRGKEEKNQEKKKGNGRKKMLRTNVND